MLIVVPPHYEVFLSFLETDGTHCLGSFTRNVDVSHILLGRGVRLPWWRGSISCDIGLLVLIGILVLVLLLDLMVLLGIILGDSLLDGTGVGS